jgi:chemotaxis response regulator CheB
VRKIRILLVGGSKRLREIMRDAVAHEPDITIAGDMEKPADLAAFTVRRRVDVVLFSRREGAIPQDEIDRLLHANPRLALLAVDAVNGCATLHHLVRADKEFPPLEQASFAAAIRAGASLRLH